MGRFAEKEREWESNNYSIITFFKLIIRCNLTCHVLLLIPAFSQVINFSCLKDEALELQFQVLFWWWHVPS